MTVQEIRKRFPKQLLTDASTQSPLSNGSLRTLFLQAIYSIIMIQSYPPSITFKCSLLILFTLHSQGVSHCHLQAHLRFGLQEGTACLLTNPFLNMQLHIKMYRDQETGLNHQEASYKNTFFFFFLFGRKVKFCFLRF